MYELDVDPSSRRPWRDAPRVSRRFTGTWAGGSDTVVGHRPRCHDDVPWTCPRTHGVDDLAITYRHRRP